MNRRAFLSAAAANCFLTTSAEAQTPPPRYRRFGAAAVYSAEHEGVSFLVSRHGVILAEDYPDGDPAIRWPIGEGTRSLAIVLAASLVEDGLMSLDEPASATLGDWGAHPLKNMISIRSLLNGTSGIAFAGRDGPRDAYSAMALEPVAAPGERFIADVAPYLLLGEIARRKLEFSGRAPDPAVYVSSRTLAPIGCTPIGWTRDPLGAPLLFDGAALSARGWGQVGELVRREGVWRAEQLIDQYATREALRGTFAEPRAGIGFWLAPPSRGADGPDGAETDLWRGASSAPSDLAMAIGAGGQRLYILPADGMVVVRQSRRLDATGWSDSEFLSLLLRDLRR